ncbi:MAG: glycosyltransferase family 2 protein [Candidatus Omnitrophica bacterium]|nr:glycosyltransferase family 2 protein [Candidatus Omnitrophota bacterium]
MSTPKISVIVPCHNARNTIQTCVKSILACSYPHFECIVVDDVSTDDSCELLKNLNCRIIRLPSNAGPGASRNAGAREASGRILVFTDADCRVEPEWLNRIISSLTDGTAAVSAGYHKSQNRETFALFQFYDTLFRQRNTPDFIDICISANFGCTKKAFDESGGFLPAFFGEDTALGLAISRKHKIKWDKNNGVAHYFNTSLNKYFAKHIQWMAGLVPIAWAQKDFLKRKATWSNHEIAGNLLLMAGFYLSVLLILVNPACWAFPVLLMALYGIVNAPFLNFIARYENYKTALGLFLFMPMRDTAWLLGLCLGAGRLLFKKCNLRMKPFALTDN